MELRCSSGILHGIIDGEIRGTGVIEVACKSTRCGKEPGVVVRHRFNLNNGELLSTRAFHDPVRSSNHASRSRLSIRSA